MIDNIFKLILKSNDWNSVEKYGYSIYAKGYCFYNDRYYNGHDILEPFLDILEEGKRSESMTLDTILRHRHVTNYLNPAFFNVIKRYMKKPSYVIHCNGLLSLIFIKTFKQNFESK